ncbi:amino acid permease [Bombilactobacillus thymidiniphilus]|uniref:Amino acid permease n=1 Tax=Bombilactobacillus thymidiniphilus TaxID=2923363 RepID=A0ABY4PEY0_9LACO|nr:amino acid permease [Bombilactobacillus thymidiniphilus]UQS84069.1 amino acid permease [Bombilactobacillus thymidiniphilus]
MATTDEQKLNKSLSSNQMQMIALGGTIGVGLFMGSASTIKWTGPSVMLAYALAGGILYLVMRALGEMLYVHPITGSFADFASEYIHPVAGYLTAWSNVFEFLLVGISEVIAVGQYLQFWWPHFPTWLAGLVVIVTLCLANLASVKAYGNLESWFALIKVITIIFMIILGLLVIVLGVGNHGQPLGISNLWRHGGFFTGGWKGFFFSLSLVIASYQGIEIVGITAGEAQDPKHSIVKSIQSLIFRILIFYVGAIFVIVSIYPWNELGKIGSPFVQTFAKVGITFAAEIINFVVLTAALSGCNSGIFSSSRMLYTLSKNGDLPRAFTKISKHKVPYLTVIVMSLGILIGMLLNEVLPVILHTSTNAFVLVYSSSVLPGMIPWFVILISDLRFRKKHANELINHPFTMPGFPITNYIALGGLLITLIFMFVNPETRISIIIGLGFEIIMFCIYFTRQHLQRN